jgi:hypothetical protein
MKGLFGGLSVHMEFCEDSGGHVLCPVCFDS